MLEKTIRIGTRKSQLALWQAKTVQDQLEALNYKTVLVPIVSGGDKDLKTPIYEMGIVGVFTRSLDRALLEDKIDIAVHSMKDVPTGLPKGIVQTAVLKRGSSGDILVAKKGVDLEAPCTIATSSLRRKAQWLHRFPHHQVVPLRGNVNTRLQKLKSENWQGAIFAKAGLERTDLLPKGYQELDWMLPAPAQGAMVVMAKEENVWAVKASQGLNNTEAFRTTFAERLFLRTLEGGCSAPIAALAEIKEDRLVFRGSLLSLDGKIAYTIEKNCPVEAYDAVGKKVARKILAQGGDAVLEAIRPVTNRVGNVKK